MKPYILVLGLVFCLPAFGYIDPGAGSFIIQAVIGSIAALMGTARLWWGWLKNRKNGKQKADENNRQKPAA